MIEPEGVAFPHDHGTRIADLEKRVKDLEDALLDSIRKRVHSEYPKYPKPVEDSYVPRLEPVSPPEVVNNGGPYALSYSGSGVEKRVSTADELGTAKNIAEIYSKSCGVAIKVRDFNGNLICEYRPDQ